MTKRKNVDIQSAELKEYLREEMRVELRPFRSSDLGRVMEIERSSFDVDAYSEDRFRDLYKMHPGGFRVAEVLGNVVGYIAGTTSGAVGEIDSMAVDPDYRRLGIAEELLRRTLKYFQDLHPELKTYSLEVRTTNEPAIHLYKKMGFHAKDRLTGYYKDNADAFMMQIVK